MFREPFVNNATDIYFCFLANGDNIYTELKNKKNGYSPTAYPRKLQSNQIKAVLIIMAEMNAYLLGFDEVEVNRERITEKDFQEWKEKNKFKTISLEGEKL